MKDTARTLEAGTETDQIAWFADFDQWQKSVFWDEMRTSAKSLSENPAPEVAKLGRKILATLGTTGETMQPKVASEIRDLVKKLKESSGQSAPAISR